MKQIADKLQNKKALFIVESPLQIMCAYEAIKTFEPKKVKIIARLADVGRNNKQMELLINEFLSDYDVEKVYLKPESRSLKFVSIAFVLIVKVLVWAATLNCPQSILEKSYTFSIFDLSSSLHIKNKFRHLSNHLLKNKVNKKDVVVFIGSPIREIQDWIKGGYFEAISKVKEKYSTMDFLYFPHRRELKEDLDKISSYDIQIVSNEYPIEMFYLEFPNYNPKVVASLYSTAMFTMSLIYGSKVVMCDGVMKENNSALENVFDAIKKIENISVPVC